MSNLKNVFIVAAVSSITFASPALAGDKYESDAESSSFEGTPAVATSAQRRNNVVKIEPSTEVLGAVERGDLIRVEGPDGRIYFNRLIPVSELPDPTLELRVLDTVQIERDDAVYTNKIVQPVN
jgi:hypothetical protein